MAYLKTSSEYPMRVSSSYNSAEYTGTINIATPSRATWETVGANGYLRFSIGGVNGGCFYYIYKDAYNGYTYTT